MTTISVKFEVTPGTLALAMTLHGIENMEDFQYGFTGEQDSRPTAVVTKMSKTQAMKILKSGFKSYGLTSWPEIPEGACEARNAAFAKADAWLGNPEPAPALGVATDLSDLPLNDTLGYPSTS